MTAAGHADDGEPRAAPQYTPDYYGAFVRDPDGNNVEVVNHNRSALDRSHAVRR
jgi:predicted lactoylglutathione lyase